MSQGRLSHASSSSLTRVGSQDQSIYWTDDLPVCQLSGVGSATNQVYRDDGYRREEHEFEDRSFHFKVENDVYLYGVFDGHDGSKVSNFATQRMPAELLLGQLGGKFETSEIEEVLRQAFLSVEKAFFDSIDDAMAEKYNLQMYIPEGMSDYDALQQFPDQVKRLEDIERELMGGSTAVVALIINNKLFVASCGCCRALLCRTDDDQVLRVTQLTVDHNLKNANERIRLADLGLNVDKLRQVGNLGNHPYTRTLGDYNVKSGYNNIELLRSARSDPVIANPEIQGGIELDSSCSFLILMSDGLYRSLEDATGTDHVNREIASMVATEFSQQSTLNGVAQAVVDRVVRLHHDAYMTSVDHRKQLCQKRDDIMLIVRNFNYPLPNGISSPTNLPLSSMQPIMPLSISIPSPGDGPSTPPPVLAVQQQRPVFFISSKTPVADISHTNNSTLSNQASTLSNRTSTLSSTYSTSTNDSTHSGSGDRRRVVQRSSIKSTPLSLDENGRIEAYVDFSGFYKAIEELNEAQRETFDAETEPKPAYETIVEEPGTDKDEHLHSLDTTTRL